MRWVFGVVLGIFGCAFCLSSPAAAACPRDSVLAGTICIDKYEASVWKTSDRSLINKIQKGTVTLHDLAKAGASQLGLTAGDLIVNGCPATGNGCTDFYAVSIEGVTPAAFISWFQARHGWQSLRMGCRLGASLNDLPGLGLRPVPTIQRRSHVPRWRRHRSRARGDF